MSAGRNINSKSKEWGTPEKYVNAVIDFFGEIDLDPCSNPNSIVNAETEFVLPVDGLKESWEPYKRVYVNPPYGIDKERKTSIKNWLEKCVESREKFGCEILALIPVATNTGHWKKSIFGKADAICFLADTRLKFLVNGKNGGKGAPMACCIVYWGAYNKLFKEVFSKYGSCVDIRELKG